MYVHEKVLNIHVNKTYIFMLNAIFRNNTIIQVKAIKLTFVL
jgi:hypothetical protein